MRESFEWFDLENGSADARMVSPRGEQTLRRDGAFGEGLRARHDARIDAFTLLTFIRILIPIVLTVAFVGLLRRVFRRFKRNHFHAMRSSQLNAS